MEKSVDSCSRSGNQAVVVGVGVVFRVVSWISSVGVIQTCQVVQWREREEEDDDDDEWTRGVALRGGGEDRGGDDSTAPKLKVGGGRHAPLVYRI